MGLIFGHGHISRNNFSSETLESVFASDSLAVKKDEYFGSF